MLLLGEGLLRLLLVLPGGVPVLALEDLQLADADRVLQRWREFTDRDGTFAEAYGLGPDGAVLVRPDGYVAWDSSNPTRLTTAVNAVLGVRELAS